MGDFQTPDEEVRFLGTSPERLAQIVQQRPDLASIVVWHPHVYDGLLDWIAAYGDGAARSAVASRRAAGAAGSPPPSPRALSTASPSLASLYAPPGEEGYPPATAGVFEAPSAPGDVHQPTTTLVPRSVVVTPYDAPTPTEKSRKGLVIGGIIIAIIVVAVSVGSWWAYNTFLRGAASPEAAVDKVLDGVFEGDPLSLMTAFAPSEVDAFKESFDSLTAIQADEFDQQDVMEKLLALHGTVDIEVEGMEYSTSYLTDDVAVVYAVKGIITVDAEPREFADAAVDTIEPIVAAQLESIGYSEAEITDELDDMRGGALEWAQDTFPVTVDIEDASDDILSDVGSGDLGIESPFMLVAVEEGGWYVSPLLTAAEYVTVAVAQDRGVQLADLRRAHVAQAVHFTTPEDAVAGTTRAIQNFIADGEVDELAAVMALPERRLLSLYVPDLPADVVSSMNMVIDEPRTTIEVDGNRARATLLEFGISVPGEGVLDYRHECFTYVDEYGGATETLCLRDIPVLGSLGVNELHGTWVREDGGWLASPFVTYADYMAVISQSIQEHVEQGTLEDVFFGSLYSDFEAETF